MDLKEKVQYLIDHGDSVPASAKDFVYSLITQSKKSSGLSDKQAYWVDYYYRLDTDSDKLLGPKVMEVSVGSFDKVYDLFKVAGAKLKYPSIGMKVVENDEETPVRFSLSSSSSKYAGTINVTDGGPYGSNIWYGRVFPTGEWQVNMKAPHDKLKVVERLLFDFAENPTKVVQEYGRLSGRCCFCSLPLTDKRSTTVGFGRTCAKNYGLLDQWNAVLPDDDTKGVVDATIQD